MLAKYQIPMHATFSSSRGSLAVAALDVGHGRQQLHQDEVLLLHVLGHQGSRVLQASQGGGDGLAVIGRQEVGKRLHWVHHLVKLILTLSIQVNVRVLVVIGTRHL